MGSSQSGLSKNEVNELLKGQEKRLRQEFSAIQEQQRVYITNLTDELRDAIKIPRST